MTAHALAPELTDADSLLAGLDPEQREVAGSLRGPVCVLAGAGTGKTRAITHRIAYGVASGVYRPSSVLAVTFTQRAAGEMRGRLAGLGAHGVQARTFHSWALRQARYFWPRVFSGELPTVLDRKFGLLADAASRNRVRVDTAKLRDLAGEIEWAKVCNAGPDDYVTVAESGRREVSGIDATTVARIFAGYEELKAERGLIDLEDVLLCAVAVLDADERVRAEVRSQYRYVVVDEYQDCSPLQQSLLDLWVGDRDEICVVGDPAQTIYSWAGADPRNLVEFARRYEHARVVRLVRDYRSTVPIVACANTILDAAGPAALPGRVELRSQRDDVVDPPAPVFTEYTDEVAEAAGIADELVKLHDGGYGWGELAVLFRINAQSEPLEQALAERGVPAVLRGAERFFDRAAVKEAAVRIRARVGALADGDSAAELPGAGAADPGGSDGAAAEVREIATAMGWSAEAPRAAGAVRERWESLSALVTMAEDHDAAPGEAAGLAGFSAELGRRASIQHAPAADAVTLATLHATKGLEWRGVFIAGAHDQSVPIQYAETPAQLEEERRLLYVGVTRARDRLAISWALARNPGGRGRRRPSRFLAPFPAVSGRPGAGNGPGGPSKRRKRGVASCRVCGTALVDPRARKLGRCEDCPADLDEDMFAALRHWRTEAAGEQKLPAYCVFTDATLTAIAEARPASEGELLKLPGIGRAKVSKYGEQVLAVCADPEADLAGSERSDASETLLGEESPPVADESA